MRAGHRAALGAIVAVSALVFLWEGASVPTAWLPFEEAATLLRARGGGTAHSAGGVLYTLLLAPAAHLLSPAGAYRFAKALSAVLFALVAIPSFVLARRLLSTRWSLGVAALAVLAPGSVYATAAVADSLALLLAVSSLALLARRNLAAALTVATLAAFARPWFVVLPPALLAAHELPRGSFLRWPRSLVFAGYAAFAYFLLAWTAPGIGTALSSPWPVTRAAAASLAVVVVGTGVVPWLVAVPSARPVTARIETALLATCLPGLLLAAGVFGAAGDGVDERPLLALVPLVLALATFAWLEGTVPLRAAAIAGGVVALAAVALPRLGRVPSAHAAGLALVAPHGASRAALAGGVVAVVAFAVLLLGVLGRRWLAVPAVVVLALLGGQAAAWSSARAEARAVAAADPVPHGWVDAHAGDGAHVFAVGPTGAFDGPTLDELTLWNRSFRGSRVVDPAGVDPKSGQLPVSDTPVALVRGADLVGAPLARSGAAGVLLRPVLPLQLAETVDGLYPDGWSSLSTTYRRFGGAQGAGTVRVSINRPRGTGPVSPSDLRFFVGPLPGTPVELHTPDLVPDIHSGQTIVHEIPVPSPPFQLVVLVDPTFASPGLNGAATRQLGAKLRFAYRPG